jgi:hypothetical protein
MKAKKGIDREQIDFLGKLLGHAGQYLGTYVGTLHIYTELETEHKLTKNVNRLNSFSKHKRL